MSRISREKVNQLSHVVTAALASQPGVRLANDRNNVRLEIRRKLEELVQQEERIDEEARRRIGTQKRAILEGSGEWDILYRKYYMEELKKLGV